MHYAPHFTWCVLLTWDSLWWFYINYSRLFLIRNNFFKIYDTAGARKKRKIDNSLEKESVKETLRAIKFAQIVILVLEPDELLNAQDQKLASLCEREGRAIVFVVNKSDKIFDKKFVDEQLKKTISKSLPQFKGAYFSYI